ncbi:hypothetical protein D3C80_1595820 [compost metagenome]
MFYILLGIAGAGITVAAASVVNAAGRYFFAARRFYDNHTWIFYSAVRRLAAFRRSLCSRKDIGGWRRLWCRSSAAGNTA